MSDYIQFEGGSFLKSFVASHPTEDAFIEASNAKGHAHWFEDDANRENKLRALYGKVSKQANVVSTIESIPAEAGSKETKESKSKKG